MGQSSPFAGADNTLTLTLQFAQDMVNPKLSSPIKSQTLIRISQTLISETTIHPRQQLSSLNPKLQPPNHDVETVQPTSFSESTIYHNPNPAPRRWGRPSQSRG